MRRSIDRGGFEGGFGSRVEFEVRNERDRVRIWKDGHGSDVRRKWGVVGGRRGRRGGSTTRTGSASASALSREGEVGWDSRGDFGCSGGVVSKEEGEEREKGVVGGTISTMGWVEISVANDASGSSSSTT